MDCNGARALAQRLKDGGVDRVVRPRLTVPVQAAPIFHWFGIAPPADADDSYVVLPTPSPADADSPA